MRALAGWGDQRLPLMPDLPTFKELGYSDVEFYIWSGVFAPVATPAPVIAKLRDAVRAAVADPMFKGAMEKVQTPISYLDAPEFRAFLAKDAARLKVAVEKIGKVEEKK
jgi:tripartite-type tricarboxylate transporter receptor subunit TctC